MHNAKTHSPFVIDLHNKDIEFQQYGLKNVDLFDKVHPNKNLTNLNNKCKTFPSLNNFNNSDIKGVYKLPKVKWDDDVMTMGSGLNNPGINICYMNVIIQVFTHTPFLSSSLIKSFHTKTCPNYDKNVFCIMCLFEKYVKESFSSPNSLNNPFYNIAKKFIWSKFKLGHQDDAFIFLKHFLDSLSKACYVNWQESNSSQKGSEESSSTTKNFISNDQIMSTVIGRLFGGYFRNVILCDNCLIRSEKVEEFFDLAVEVTKSNRLIDLLSQFVLPEKLTNDNKYFCSNCKSYQNANKSLSLYKCPRILNINLKRFNCSLGSYKKSHKAIDFPQLLSISLKTSPKAYTWLNYELYAIVCHIGKSLNMGHYITFIKGKNGFWYCFDDSVIQSVSEAKVLSHKNDVYMLFYAINNESVDDCDTALNKYSYTNIFDECPYSFTNTGPEGDEEDSKDPEDVNILSNLDNSTVLKRFIRHKKYKNFRLLKMKFLSNSCKLNNKRKNHLTPSNSEDSQDSDPEESDQEDSKGDSTPEDTLNFKKDSEMYLKILNESNKLLNSSKHDKPNTLKKNDPTNGKSPQNKPKCSFNNEHLKKLVLNQDNDVEVWSDAEDLDTYKKLYSQIDRDLPKPTEEDMEYDRGKLHKAKNRNRQELTNLEVINHNSGLSVAVAQKNLFDNKLLGAKRSKNHL